MKRCHYKNENFVDFIDTVGFNVNYCRKNVYKIISKIALVWQN